MRFWLYLKRLESKTERAPRSRIVSMLVAIFIVSLIGGVIGAYAVRSYENKYISDTMREIEQDQKERLNKKLDLFSKKLIINEQ